MDVLSEFVNNFAFTPDKLDEYIMEGCLEAKIIKLEELKTINENEYIFYE